MRSLQNWPHVESKFLLSISENDMMSVVTSPLDFLPMRCDVAFDRTWSEERESSGPRLI